MMSEHIDHIYCPDCGADVISETKSNQHCNGYWNEEVKFKCGAVFHFSPNFLKVEQSKPCSQTDKQKAIKAKRVSALTKTKNYINTLNVDLEFKSKLLEQFSYLYIG
jgi:predicted RNA-binding Zn-ribbon protein involved in translation (DUF1610 family)